MGGGVATQGDVDGPQWRCWAGLSGQQAAGGVEDRPGANLGGGWIVWRMGQADGSGADGAIRQEMVGLAIERGRD